MSLSLEDRERIEYDMPYMRPRLRKIYELMIFEHMNYREANERIGGYNGNAE